MIRLGHSLRLTDRQRSRVGGSGVPTLAPVLTFVSDDVYLANIAWTSSNNIDGGSGYRIYVIFNGAPAALVDDVPHPTLTYEYDGEGLGEGEHVLYIVPYNSSGDGPPSNELVLELPVWVDPLAGMPGLYSYTLLERNGQPWGLWQDAAGAVPATMDGDLVSAYTCWVTGLLISQSNPLLAMTLRNEGGHWVLEGGAGKFLRFPSAMLGMFRNLTQAQVWVASAQPDDASDQIALLATVTAAPSGRSTLYVRSSPRRVGAGARRLDADSTATAFAVGGADNVWDVITAEYDYAAGFVRAAHNNGTRSTTPLTGGAGVSQNADSQAISLGATTTGTLASLGRISGVVIAQHIPDSTWQATVQSTLEAVTP